MVDEVEHNVIIGLSNNVSLTNSILSNANVVHPGGVQAQIVSTSAADSSTGTGIQQVLITYFDSSWVLNEEIIIPNGTTPVDTVATNIYRIDSFDGIQTGSNNGAVGTLKLQSLDGTNLFAQISPGDTYFKRALHYIKRGWRCTFKSLIMSCPTSYGVILVPSITLDYTSIGGGYTIGSFIPITLKNGNIVISGDQLPVVDATNSAKALGVFVCAQALGTGQQASIYCLTEEYHVKDV